MKQDSPIRAILELANRHVERGEVHQAKELYLRVLEQHPRTREAAEAKRSVLAIARRLEAGGQPRLALSLYLKLAASSASGTDDEALGSCPEEPVGGGGEPGLPVGSDRRGRPLGPKEEIPFVDLTHPAKIKRNFERLGSVKRTDAQISRAIAKLRELKP